MYPYMRQKQVAPSPGTFTFPAELQGRYRYMIAKQRSSSLLALLQQMSC